MKDYDDFPNDEELFDDPSEAEEYKEMLDEIEDELQQHWAEYETGEDFDDDIPPELSWYEELWRDDQQSRYNDYKRER